MPMRQIYKFDQSDDKFEREPQGVCQALSARWVVSRALWDPRRDGDGTDASWMGEKRDMEAHVWRIYSATRSARAAVAREEQGLMEQVRQRFEADKQAALKRQRRMATGAAAVREAGAPAAAEPTPTGFSPADLDARLSRVYVPTLPRMLDALRKDIEEHSGLDGAVHTYNDVAPAHVAHKVCALGAGYKLIDVRDPGMAREGGAHAIAAEIRFEETRLYDPNAGEFKSEPPGNPWEAFGTLVNFLLGSGYGLESIRYLSVIHFPLKSASR